MNHLIKVVDLHLIHMIVECWYYLIDYVNDFRESILIDKIRFMPLVSFIIY